ncbi:MAG: phosphoribosylglycinamide formyltransferase [Bacteroidetes bacterium]|nr:MAG: phosphoribosylglycinamide formyltransferase [Bacteroidota bacterium]
MINLAIFASGSGTNAQQIIEHFKDSSFVSIKHIFCNRKDAYVLNRAKDFLIPSTIFSKKEFYHSTSILEKLLENKIDYIILAGFLWLIPLDILKEFPNRIINIHPALLPKYGGKGMYGGFVHEAVIKNREKESGITIHFVNEKYDDGEIIFQANCNIDTEDTPENLAAKIHKLEHEHFPKIIEKVVLGNQ